MRGQDFRGESVERFLFLRRLVAGSVCGFLLADCLIGSPLQAWGGSGIVQEKQLIERKEVPGQMLPPAVDRVAIAGEVQEEDKGTPAASSPKTEDEPLIQAQPSTAPPIGPREIRFHLWDGTIVRGDVGYSAIHIQTQFGRLEVPVSQIVSVRPGLQSLPGLRGKVDELIEKLGDREFQTREVAKQKLQALGPQFLEYLRTVSDGGSSERKKHLQAIIEAWSEQLASDNDSGEAQPLSLGLEDSITTAAFTIVGRIEEVDFELTTQYGLLKIKLNDIRLGDREWGNVGERIEKRVEIACDAFFQREPKSTRIRVNVGDKIVIRSEGSITWTSWGNVNSGPEGINSHGQWRNFDCGKLVARIGSGDYYEPIGQRREFVAKQSGELFLGIAMQDQYVQQGYQWAGQLKAHVRVESQR